MSRLTTLIRSSAAHVRCRRRIFPTSTLNKGLESSSLDERTPYTEVCFPHRAEFALPKQPLKRRHEKQYRVANRPCSGRCSDSAVCRKSDGERSSSENPNSLACSERPNCAEQRHPATQFECPSRFCCMLQRTLLLGSKDRVSGIMAPDKGLSIS